MNAILYSLTIFLLFFEKILLLCCLFQMKIKSYGKFVDMPQNGKTYNHINKMTAFLDNKRNFFVHNGFFNHHLSNYKLIESSTFTLVFIPFIFEA